MSRDEVVAIAGGTEEAAAKMMAAMEDIPNSANGYIELHEWLRYVRKQKATLKAPGASRWACECGGVQPRRCGFGHGGAL